MNSKIWKMGFYGHGKNKVSRGSTKTLENFVKEEAASLPPYSKMILAAITELGEKDGSSEQAISQQIESTYKDRLQADHSAVLYESLDKLKESGKLLFIRDNYLKPDDNNRPRRSRGRPPKPKPDLAEGAELESPKQPSVSAKEKDSASSASTGKKRGRPSKNSRSNGGSDMEIGVAKQMNPKRGRGRPPKASYSAVEATLE